MAGNRDNKDLYNELLQQDETLPIFFEPWWLDAVCGSNNWEVILSFDKGKQIRGFLPYFTQRIKNLPVISNPPFTPMQGPVLIHPQNQASRSSKYSFENKVLEELVGMLPKKTAYINISCSPGLENWYPFFWNGFEQTTRYTYILQNIGDQDKIYSGFSNNLKRQIRGCEDMYFKTGDNSEILYDFMSNNLRSQGLKTPLSKDKFKLLCEIAKEKNRGEIYKVCDKNDKVLASMFMVWDNNTAYALALGMDENAPPNNSMKLLLWESIKEASNHVENYNFEGSMIRNVERVFRSFGGSRIPYYNLSWYRNRWIKAGFALLKK